MLEREDIAAEGGLLTGGSRLGVAILPGHCLLVSVRIFAGGRLRSSGRWNGGRSGDEAAAQLAAGRSL
jgi:hypothetical protein